jgi:hypothetical protein
MIFESFGQTFVIAISSSARQALADRGKIEGKSFLVNEDRKFLKNERDGW